MEGEKRGRGNKKGRERKRDNSTFALRKKCQWDWVNSLACYNFPLLYTTYVCVRRQRSPPDYNSDIPGLSTLTLVNFFPSKGSTNTHEKTCLIFVGFFCSEPFFVQSGEYSNFGANVSLKENAWLFRLTCHGFLVTCNATLCERNKNIPHPQVFLHTCSNGMPSCIFMRQRSKGGWGISREEVLNDCLMFTAGFVKKNQSSTSLYKSFKHVEERTFVRINSLHLYFVIHFWNIIVGYFF